MATAAHRWCCTHDVGSSPYFGLDQAWGGPVANRRVGVVTVGVGRTLRRPSHSWRQPVAAHRIDWTFDFQYRHV